MNKNITTDILSKANEAKENQISCDVSGVAPFETVCIDVALTPEKYAELVRNIATACFDSDDNYYPFMRSISFTANVFDMMTNINAEDLSVIYEFSHKYNVAVARIESIIELYYPELKRDIDALIEYRIQKSVHKSAFDVIANKVVDFVDGAQEQLENLDASDLDKMIKMVETFAGTEESGGLSNIVNLIGKKTEADNKGNAE